MKCEVRRWTLKDVHVRVRVPSGSLTIAESTKGYADERIARLQSVTVNEQSAHDIIGPFRRCAVFHMCLLWKTRSTESRVQTPPRAERTRPKTGNQTPASLPLVVLWEDLLVYASDASNRYVSACRNPEFRDQSVEAQQQAPFPVLPSPLASRHDTRAREG